MPYTYEPWLVVLSFILAVLASYTALSLAARVPHVEQKRATLWLSGGAVGMGVGIWAMHFVGMLAFHLPIPLSYDIPITIASALLAIVASGFALHLIRHGITRTRTLISSAALMGSGIAAMHYTGMEALQMSPAIEYDPGIVALSLLIAFAASLFALKLAFHSRNETPLLFSGKQLLSAILMGAAIAGMHYVGMSAAHFDANSICLAAPRGIDNAVMAVIISSLTLLLLLATMLLLNYDIHRAKQNAQLVRELKDLNHQLRAEAARMAEAMTESLRQNSQRDRLLAAIVEQSGEAIITTDLFQRISSWNGAAENMFGYRFDEVQGNTLEFLMMEPISPAREGYYHCQSRNGETIYVLLTASPLLDDQHECIGENIMMHDVTKERQDHEQLLLWSLVYRHSGEAIVISDPNNRILSVNDSFTRITGFTAEEAIGQNPSLLASGRHGPEFYQQMWETLQSEGHWKGEIWNRRKDGTVYPEWITITTLHDDSGKPSNYIAIFSDASSYKEKEARIHFLAHHDALTGLPNRTLLQDRLEQAVNKARRDGNKIAILFIDLDRFKVINDTLGHHVGDLLLKEVAQRLNRSVRDSDTVCRQGGDEFIIVLPEIETISDVAHVAQKILENVSRDFLLEGERLKVTPSIGISLFPEDGERIDVLIKNADTAMYHAKESGRANFQFFTERLNTILTERMELERDLASALTNGELELYFQPQVDLHSGRIIGAESLLRWHHPIRGMVPPDQFIPIAEEAGLINEIGLWVLDEMLRKAVEWKSERLFNGMIFSANVSPRQLDDPGFVDAVAALFLRHNYPPECIELEVTETAVMEDIHRSITTLSELKELGVHLAIDDFGTGYSSLNYLKRLPIDRLKIDRSFISDIPKDKNDETITRAIINLAHTLNLGVIAEGVETEEQANFLRNAQCHDAQGFLYARPLAATEFVKFVRQRAAT
jgi:diguanylate cyclase (GGDEF)-like protein/PAS domain S-box-containing protein